MRQSHGMSAKILSKVVLPVKMQKNHKVSVISSLNKRLTEDALNWFPILHPVL